MILDTMLSDEFLQTVGAWTLVIVGGFVAFCVVGFTMDLIEEGYHWMRNRR